jgi:hypothetical protein
MEVVSKPGQDKFLHTILVHSIIEKEIKYTWPNGAHQKNIKKTIKLTSEPNIIKTENHILTSNNKVL